MTDFTATEKRRIKQIANIMREQGDDCTEERLIRRGVTRAELKSFAEAATERANADFARAA